MGEALMNPANVFLLRKYTVAPATEIVMVFVTNVVYDYEEQ